MLPRALEQAVEEANAIAEVLEAATGDNAGLQEAVAEKERALEALRRENEGLRASETAARERAEELQGQLAAARKEREIPLVEKWKREDAQGKLGAGMFLDSGRKRRGREEDEGTGADRREKGRRGGRRVVGPIGAKSSFHMAVNGSRMEKLTECRIRNER